MHSSLQHQNFTAYLDQFIGQPKETILAKADFKTFGFDTTTPTLQNKNQIVYTIIRPLNIPLPIPVETGNSGGSGGRISTNTASLANSYQMNVTCNIIFHLENNIATKWESKGKAC
ncbi:hypothetical protein CAP51_03980 [Acinetobacter populi]|uniref:Uncharacterized protein n=2 Tax=Acinetobacter populi TaxID=1582270 RepID=A0A1Z9Z2S9_9GAMM|nr:hypothetical protein CAP51_03980 [Acinetobacter populi]